MDPDPGHRAAPTPGRWVWRAGSGRRVGWVVGSVAVGTAAAYGVDALVGPVDGHPAVYLLVLQALPFWDRLPAGLWRRLAVLVGLAGAVAAVWWGLAGLRPEPWWRAEVAFGLACALVGTVHALRPGRTVER